MTESAQIAILGAGMSGLCMGIQLLKHGFKSFIILEKASDVGGTWRENVYPGVACDVPSYMYSFSFELNPSWSRRFSPGSEIQSYCKRCAHDYDLYRYIRFGAEVSDVSFDDQSWEIQCTDGRTVSAEFVVSALGGLHIPNIPDFPGLESYGGCFFHSAQWPSNTELQDKRVGVIGSGASAVQIVPAIAPTVRKVELFQRTPAWVLPRLDQAFSKGWLDKVARLPILMRFLRWVVYWSLEFNGLFRKREGRRNRTVEKLARQYLNVVVKDEELRAKVTPSFAIGCKRIMLSDDYYQSLQLPQSQVVTKSIERFWEKGVCTTDGEMHELDVVIVATGFKPFAIHDAVSFSGRDGLTLSEQWQNRIQAHRTVMVPKFPNLFFLLGPNSGLGHNSVVFMIETQVKYIIKTLARMRRRKLSVVEPKTSATTSFNTWLQAELRGTVFGGGCAAWYTDDHDHNFTLWPRSTMSYWWRMRRVHTSEFNWEKH